MRIGIAHFDVVVAESEGCDCFPGRSAGTFSEKNAAAFSGWLRHAASVRRNHGERKPAAGIHVTRGDDELGGGPRARLLDRIGRPILSKIREKAKA